MDHLNELLRQARSESLFSHASLAVVRDGEVLFHAAVGGAPSTVFDVASLTKVFTATLVVDTLDVDERLTWLDGAPTISDLLAHRSGLPAWRPLFATAAQKLGCAVADLATDVLLQRKARDVYRHELSVVRADAAKPTYSDLGFIALGFALEDSAPLDVLARRLFDSLGLHDTRWGGAQAVAPPTGDTRPRGWLPQQTGVAPAPSVDHGVDDDNAMALGGRCGHAGVWSTACDVARLGGALRTSEGTRALLFTPAGGGRTFGLDTPTGESPSIGSILGRGPLGAAGHLGFTGCSLWIDRDAGLSIALLTNAARFERPPVRLRAWRRTVHDAVARTFA